MTTPLAEQLQRIADEAPAVPVDPTTWVRARSARRRDRGLVALAAAVVVGIVATTTLALPGADQTPQPAAPIAPVGAGLPERIDYISGPGPDPDPGTDAVGAAVAAYVNDDGAAVLVGADGVYHRIDLADRTGPVALSPDGTKLAYGVVSGDQARLDVFDLVEGAVAATPTRRMVSFERLSWDSSGYAVAAEGRDAAGTFETELLRVGGSVTNGHDITAGARVALTVKQVAVAVSDGAVTALRVRRDAPPIDTLTPTDPSPVAGACAYEVTAIALRGSSTSGWTAWAYEVRPNSLIETRRALPTAVDGRDLSVVGCLEGPDRLLVRSGDDLAVLTLGGAPSYAVVAQVDPGLAGLSVATDLVTGD